jgi:hypothetical protein
MGRYDGRTVLRNQELSYSDVLQQKELQFIDQYQTANLTRLTAEAGLGLTRIQHVWSLGDRLWKLADQHYGDPTYWWLIAWYNQKPTESHFAVGDVVIIPTPFERVLSLYNGGK